MSERRKADTDALRHGRAHGTYAAALYRIAQGVEDPQAAARMVLESEGWDLSWLPSPAPGMSANDEARRCPKCNNLWTNHAVTTQGTMAPCPRPHTTGGTP